jgi:hypothetical protein
MNRRVIVQASLDIKWDPISKISQKVLRSGSSGRVPA